MPLLFALVGLLALALSVLIFVGPVVLAVGVVRAIRGRRIAARGTTCSVDVTGTSSTHNSTDAVFLELVSAQWPEEGAALLAEHITGDRD